jgi:hypothetical protein
LQGEIHGKICGKSMEINLIHGNYGEILGESIQKMTEHPWKICGDFMRKFTGHRRSNHGKIGTWIGKKSRTCFHPMKWDNHTTIAL